jgi:hypothetical protein
MIKTPLAAWSLATRPKKEGGLGILNLQTQNDAHLLKNLHKFYNKIECPWVNRIWDNYYRNGKLPNHIANGSFWWRALLKLLDKYKRVAMVQVQDGSSVLMWKDMWNNKERMLESPELYSFTTKINISLSEVKAMDDFHENFQLPLTNEAFQQYNSLNMEIENLEITSEPHK